MKQMRSTSDSNAMEDRCSGRLAGDREWQMKETPPRIRGDGNRPLTAKMQMEK